MRIPKLVLSLCAAGMLAAAVAGPAATAAGASHTAAAHAPPQDGQTFTHEAGGITFDLPDGWKAAPDGNFLLVGPPGGGISVSFWVTEDDDFEDATKELGEELGKQIQNLKLDGEPKEDTHNGMEHVAVTGSGQVGARDVIFSADLLQAKKPVIVLTVGSAENLPKHAEAYTKLVKSIKKVG